MMRSSPDTMNLPVSDPSPVLASCSPDRSAPCTVRLTEAAAAAAPPAPAVDGSSDAVSASTSAWLVTDSPLRARTFARTFIAGADVPGANDL